MKPTTTLASGRTPEGALLVLQEHDGHHYLKIDGVALMSTVASRSEQEMADLACDRLGAEPRVLIGGLGFGYTLRRVLELGGQGATVVVAELLPEVIAWNREILQGVNGALLDDPRVVLDERDVHEVLRTTGALRYDAILLDVDNSPDPLVKAGNARLYARAGLQMTRNALRPGGRVVFWSALRDAPFARALEGVFARVESVGAKAYPQARRFSHTLFVAERE